MTTVEERRRHRRLPVRTTVRCRRLGPGGYDEEVRSLDLSAGGALLVADDRLAAGDVLELDLEIGGIAVSLRGLVVHTRPAEGDGRYVHVAFTGLSGERPESLARLLDDWEREVSA